MPDAFANESSDEVLAQRLVAGDPDAFESLVRRHESRVRTLCLRLTGSSHDSEDLTQETFLRVYRHRDTYRTDRPFRLWLNRICVNVCLSHMERQRRRAPVGQLAEYDDSKLSGPDTEAAVQRDPAVQAGLTDLVKSVQQIVQSLAAPYRSALVLRVFGNLSYQEIAEELGCSIGTVMSRINRARIKVKDHLKDTLC